MAESLRILSIGAHPADIFDQSGGTMAHHTSRGDYVACVVLTHGARVHDAVISDSMFHREEVPDESDLLALMEERSDVKAEEVRKGCKILGVEDIYFFGADDAVLLVTEETVKRLARLLREVRPDIILTHFSKEGDGLTNAHAIAGQITLHAISHAGSVDPGDRNTPHKVAQVFFFGAGGSGYTTKRMAVRGWVLQRCVYRHHGCSRQKAGSPRLSGEPRVWWGVCSQTGSKPAMGRSVAQAAAPMRKDLSHQVPKRITTYPSRNTRSKMPVHPIMSG